MIESWSDAVRALVELLLFLWGAYEHRRRRSVERKARLREAGRDWWRA